MGTKKKGEACGDLDRTMQPVLRCSSMNAAQVSFSLGLRGYTLAILGTNISFRSMVWSKGWWGGSWSWVDLVKTSAKSEQKSRREISLDFSAWASSMDIVTLLMFSSRGGYSQRDLSILGEKSIENVFQSMMEFHFCNQGIPRII